MIFNLFLNYICMIQKYKQNYLKNFNKSIHDAADAPFHVYVIPDKATMASPGTKYVKL